MVTFVFARHGNIGMDIVLDDMTMCVQTTSENEIAAVIKRFGIRDHVYYSPSMTRASEFGFESDGDAKNIWENALKKVDTYNTDVIIYE